MTCDLPETRENTVSRLVFPSPIGYDTDSVGEPSFECSKRVRSTFIRTCIPGHEPSDKHRERSRVISSLFVIPWRGLEPTSGSRASASRAGVSRAATSRSAEPKAGDSRTAARKEQRPTLLVRDFIGDAGAAPLRVVFERFDESPHEFSPIVFYGPTATGKTHLAWLLAARAAGLAKPAPAKSPAARTAVVKPNPVFWTSGSEFVRQVAHAIEADAIHDFRRRVQSAPAFILDGLDAVAGRGPAQAELLVLLDDCRRRNVSPNSAPSLPAALRYFLSPHPILVMR